ncbi:MAG TPA: riboflavin synthase [Candidatus Eisenbacteria bacterium]|nr:riboflavin synthase [Candidatus Eisenbacteria bacterium]
MFSGIVQAVGVVEAVVPVEGARRIRIGAALERVPAPGESIATSGVCLTVERADARGFEVTAVLETLRVTTLGALAPGRRVNLEPALRVGDPLGGHWVLGHVDAVARVLSVARGPGETRVAIEIPEPLRRYVAAKGSVTLDGVSLTVASWADPVAEVALVPFTLDHTTLGALEPGDEVNLEADLVARYLDRLLESRGVPAADANRAAIPGGRNAR